MVCLLVSNDSEMTWNEYSARIVFLACHVSLIFFRSLNHRDDQICHHYGTRVSLLCLNRASCLPCVHLLYVLHVPRIVPSFFVHCSSRPIWWAAWLTVVLVMPFYPSSHYFLLSNLFLSNCHLWKCQVIWRRKKYFFL